MPNTAMPQDPLTIGHKSDGKLVQRPMSPHLQVYRPQMTSILSIMNRVTGIISTVGTVMLVWWLAALAYGPDAYGTVTGFMGSPIGLFMLFGWTAALMYHFFGGLRHLAWDMGYGYELREVYTSGWATIIATVVFTSAIWAVALFMGVS